jgi:hypothetical protein
MSWSLRNLFGRKPKQSAPRTRGKAVWTPRGYEVPSSGSDDEPETAQLGMPGYGGRDSSPPGAGWGFGRIYNQ